MLNGLALAGRRPLGDGTGGEEYDLPGCGTVKETKVAEVGCVSEHHRIRRRIGAFQDEDRRYLHQIPTIRERNPRERRQTNAKTICVLSS